MQKTNKKQRRPFVDENPIEAKRDIPSGVAASLTEDLLKPAITKDVWEQLLGVDASSTSKEKTKISGDILEGENLDIKALEKIQYVEPGLDYRREIIHVSERTARENTFALERRIQEIIVELKKLASSSQELETAFAQVSVASAPEQPGKYHLNFFEWVLSVVHSARLRVEESQTWLALFASKRAKRQYWSMFKKHGTSFGLSNERVVATQTG